MSGGHQLCFLAWQLSKSGCTVCHLVEDKCSINKLIWNSPKYTKTTMALNVSLDFFFFFFSHFLSRVGEMGKEGSATQALLKFNLRNQEELFCTLFNRHISSPGSTFLYSLSQTYFSTKSFFKSSSIQCICL